ncbi:MAG: hypothetical protein IH606_16710 [Burkholderiales bacterium]|nr:hypothetical protein [Burkholderiales bacterium]
MLDKRLEKIALDHLGIPTLKRRDSDSLDFHDLAVWQIRKALEAAYWAGVFQSHPAGGSDAHE